MYIVPPVTCVCGGGGGGWVGEGSVCATPCTWAFPLLQMPGYDTSVLLSVARKHTCLSLVVTTYSANSEEGREEPLISEWASKSL